MNDRKLRQNVLDELEFDPSICAVNIGVSVDEGVVTLSGHVKSYAEKMAAERAVRRVKGVRAIAQEVEVRYPEDKKTADDEIAKRAVNILRWHAMIPQDALEVTVEKGFVTVSGELAWDYQRKQAEEAVRKLSGVVGVISNISLTPIVGVPDVKKKIEDALARHAQSEACGIKVSVQHGNKVYLEGEVDNWEERDLVRDAAWSVAGVQSVEDRLTIAA
jgi:osmotically-inducible protein OsmY